MKRNIEWKQKDLRGLEDSISHHESSLGRAGAQPEGTLASDDGHSDSEAKGAPEEDTATALITGDAPSVSIMPKSLVPPPGEEETMEVDEPDDHQPPASPVSHMEDDLLTGSDAAGVQGEMANFKLSSLRGHNSSDRGASN